MDCSALADCEYRKEPSMDGPPVVLSDAKCSVNYRMQTAVAVCCLTAEIHPSRGNLSVARPATRDPLGVTCQL